MKFKTSTISISILLVGLLVYGFISLNSNDPYTDYAPGVETSITTGYGTQSDTIPPGSWPYPQVWNFYHGNIALLNGGTVGASFFMGRYWFNRWNATVCNFMLPTGPNGGPGGTITSGPYQGSIRDMAITPATSPLGHFIWGGKASTTLYKFDSSATTVGTFPIPGASFRAVAYDPVRNGFWNSNFGGNITCYSTTGTLLATFVTTTTGKYGMAYDDMSTPGQKFLWVWDQAPANTLLKINVTGTPTLAGSYLWTSGAMIAGGAEAYPSPDGSQFWITLNFQNNANVAYKLADLAPAFFCEDFEGFTVGQRLACQDSVNWTTWSLDPCNTTEDPMISNAQSFSPTKSVVIVQNNDLVKPLGNDTTGIHRMTFKFYVATGKAGYWNTLATFAAPTYQWGMECYFDVAATGNNGRLFGGSSVAVPFAYTHGAWQTATLIVNLDIDSAKFIINGSVIHTWRWTAGASGTAVPKRLAANDFFGATSVDEMFMDNYCYYPNSSWIITGVTPVGSEIPSDYTLGQNYPNPFNPSTKINFAIPTTGLVTMKIYDVLGKEVASLLNETKVAGNYTVDFDGSKLSSGVYFYRIEANDFVAVKRMMLIK